ncbi:glucose-1-phosphate adenylyltransferase [Anaerobacillus arseniciselenatis]|uniref:Glucose-1-phosphate adenylyltransferase n=1 Tax=Anaerobacillus arseniciselenatis TaxID=85682 RepID=A0A1S2LTQ9_9BACI|nr:glucose-1-phosphate adenylyltransferase [Anaerobacillus arseniciselenatis]OIJ15523.1 glucose-1-phosphate adenylyltransferase [Anaerobacillus arseniciselenatis]
MKRKQCVAMLLAGGRGTRLQQLTDENAKPAVPFGGKYRIIDFTLSNCRNSGIDTVGVLTQYQPHILQNYLGRGDAWDLYQRNGGLTILPPYQCKHTDRWYDGTAHAIFQNLHFIEQYDPEHVLVISGDHIYKMDYNKMLEQHIATNADATISVMGVPWKEASRFGIMNIDEISNRIVEFEEKPQFPSSNLASMGIYIFKWSVLKEFLEREEKNDFSSKDFGKDIIPAMLINNQSLYSYKFNGYWKDVGTLESYWEANMDLLNKETNIFFTNKEWEISTVENSCPPQYLDRDAVVKQSLTSGGNEIYGTVDHSVLFGDVKIGRGSFVKNSVVLPGATIGENVKIENAIVGEGVFIPDNYSVPSAATKEITLIGETVEVERMSLSSLSGVY